MAGAPPKQKPTATKAPSFSKLHYPRDEAREALRGEILRQCPDYDPSQLPDSIDIAKLIKLGVLAERVYIQRIFRDGRIMIVQEEGITRDSMKKAFYRYLQRPEPTEEERERKRQQARRCREKKAANKTKMIERYRALNNAALVDFHTIAALLNLDVRTAHNRMHKGKLGIKPQPRTGRQPYKFMKRDVEALLAKLEQNTTDHPPAIG